MVSSAHYDRLSASHRILRETRERVARSSWSIQSAERAIHASMAASNQSWNLLHQNGLAVAVGVRGDGARTIMPLRNNGASAPSKSGLMAQAGLRARAGCALAAVVRDMLMEPMRVTGCLLVFAAAATCQVAHQHHPPSAAEYAKVLEDPSRDAWQKPHEVVMALGLKPNEAIADIGAGTGYFARRFANHAGKVYAVDIDQKLLDIAGKNAPPNLETVLAAPDDPRLPDGSVDTIFICEVLHHIENRAAYYPKLARALKPGGRIVIIDFFKKELPVGPPVEMKIPEERVVAELKQAGFSLTKRLDFLPYQYFLLFERR